MSFWIALILICAGIVIVVCAALLIVNKNKKSFAIVQDMHGNPMAQGCTVGKAQRMIAEGEAELIQEGPPMVIRLSRPWSPKGMFYR